jgi:amidohydrolase
MMKSVSNELFEYTTRIFRQLHMYPEIGFDLYKTTALVAAELDELGIVHTDKYGKCSLVGQIGNRDDLPTLAIRADMDALPVHEIVDVPYKSKIDGVMHACGHDSHTAILLAVAKVLKSKEAELPCNVRLLFQPSEECAVSGAKMMADNGCLEGVDSVICLHCDGAVESGELAVQVGPCMAACVPLRIQFHGLTSHATIPEKGIDAIAMAVESYGRLKEMVKEEAGDQPYIWSIGVFKGGEVHNVIADFCTQDISFRFYDMDFAERVHKRTQQIIQEIADKFGGRAELEWNMSCPPVLNDRSLVEQMRAVAKDMGVPMSEMQPRKSSEDFSWFTAQRPGMLFRYGIHNEANGCVATAHRPDFKIDEEAMKTAILAFVNFVMQYHGQ